jgi:hypothetical protein
MVPDSVLHKRNGHRKLPHPGALSAGELVSLVHSAPERLSDVSEDLLRFALLVQNECPSSAGARFAGPDPAPFPAVAQALCRSREAFARGELADIRASLEALQAQAALAAEIIARLSDVVRASDSQRYAASDRRLLNVNDLLEQALDAVTAPRPGFTAVARLDAGLPSVAGDPTQISEILITVLLAAARANQLAGRLEPIAVETSHRDGVLKGETIVQVAIAAGDPLSVDARAEIPGTGAPAEARTGLDRAARLVREHGGILTASGLGGGIRFTVELPAV